MMSDIRQTAWTKNEDTILVNTVLRYIREGRTQLDAFEEVAHQLSRTPAACGFRWNATLRKQYDAKVKQAKSSRQKSSRSNDTNKRVLPHALSNINEHIHTAIALLETLKNTTAPYMSQIDEQKMIKQLQEENKRLQKKLMRYEAAWQEMEKIANWVYKKDE